MRVVLWILLPVIAIATAGCSRNNNSKEKALAQVWTGPVRLKLRAEIHPQSPTVVEVKHGEPLDVLQVRRRFVRVRTSAGVQGWTELRNLLGEEQMADLGALAKRAAKLPSQGQATVYEPLNVHTEPSRPSTSFYQLTEGMKVDVVEHQLVPRTNRQPPVPFRIQKAAPPPRKKSRRQPKTPPVPRPPGPGVPSNWVELSKSTLPPEPPPPPPPPVPMEDWTLVRTKDGHAGWVLSRNLVMAIPDEVAQYSEGARITSYFPLAEVRDGDETKHHWLWTTIRGGGKPYQFDSFRVFTYVLRKHRFETAYIERNVEGYYPVSVERGATPKFSLILRGPDGKLYRKTWVLEGYITRKIAEEPYDMPASSAPALTGEDEDSEEDESDGLAPPSLVDRLKSFFRNES